MGRSRWRCGHFEGCAGLNDCLMGRSRWRCGHFERDAGLDDCLMGRSRWRCGHFEGCAGLNDGLMGRSRWRCGHFEGCAGSNDGLTCQSRRRCGHFKGNAGLNHGVMRWSGYFERLRRLNNRIRFGGQGCQTWKFQITGLRAICRRERFLRTFVGRNERLCLQQTNFCPTQEETTSKKAGKTSRPSPTFCPPLVGCKGRTILTCRHERGNIGLKFNIAEQERGLLIFHQAQDLKGISFRRPGQRESILPGSRDMLRASECPNQHRLQRWICDPGIGIATLRT